MVDKRNRILYIKQYLDEYADELHPVTMNNILSYLKTKGLTASRKSITQDIEELISFGVDIVCAQGNPIEYFIGDRIFELPELKLLTDAVQASRFIPPRKSETLISKLTSLASKMQSGELNRSLYTDKKSCPVNEKAYITVDLLHTAVNQSKKIICKYFDWGADKRKIYKHRRRNYLFSPYGLVWNNDRYYVVGWSDSHDKVITLRVDRIAAPKLTEEPAKPAPKGFNMAFYADSVIHMYDGSVRKVALLCKNDMMKHIIDRFGESVDTAIINNEQFKVMVSVPASPTFFAWIFTFGGGIKITEPEDVAKAYRDMARTALC